MKHECGYLYLLKDDGIIRACAICNPYANEEYKQVPWKDNDGPVWIIHTLAVDYDRRGRFIQKAWIYICEHADDFLRGRWQ